MATQEKIKVGSIVHRKDFTAPDPRRLGIVLSIPAADWMGPNVAIATVYWFTAKESGWHALVALVAVLT